MEQDPFSEMRDKQISGANASKICHISVPELPILADF
jgi:hypothetical protein